MRDVSQTPNTLRIAAAEATLSCAAGTLSAVSRGDLPEPDPISAARLAGIQAAKNTGTFIPCCHQVPLDFVGIDITPGVDSLRIVATVKAVWKTGVEMEALTAASAAALTLYGMLKDIDGGMELRAVRLLDKEGMKSDLPPSPGRAMTAGVLVLSDAGARGTRADTSGSAIRQRLEAFGLTVKEYVLLPDDEERIVQELIRWCDTLGLDVILTTGGTGLGPRDVTPEATRKVIQRELPGVAETLRAHGQERNRRAMLSRGVAGVRGKTVLVNLPGSTPAVTESLDVLLPWLFHAAGILRGGGH